MKTRSLLFPVIALVLCAVAFSCGRAPQPDAAGALVVYVYDSFAAEWGPGPKIAEAFKAATGKEISMVKIGDAGQVLTQAIAEKANPVADVIVGIDGNLAPRAIAEDLLVPYKPKSSGVVATELMLDKDWRLTPFDWGAFAVIWDSEKLQNPPTNLAELTDPRFAKKLVIMDPRTSTPGLGLLAWTVAVYGDGASDYWKRLKPSVLTMTPGWDAGYGLFVEGEVPLVLSYTTSPAYHVENDKTERYKALVFPEGHPVQVEGAGIVKGSKRMDAAKAFVDFLLSPEVQKLIPTTQWMYPIDPSVELPASFAAAPKPGKLVKPDPELVSKAMKGAVEAITAP